MIHPYRQRRIELWILFSISFGMTAFFLWFLVFREALFLLWFGIPFAVLTMMIAWKVTRPDCAFRREEEREEAFFNKHPILASFLILASVTEGLWTISEIILRLIKQIFAP
jgi:hypothetical protein